MDKKYQIELDEFRENFKEYKNSRIVLYGIGRYTATLVEGLKEFNFVGLMDKDPGNVGKEMFGLPIIDREKAEQIADIVVINTSETYWDVIYSRIENTAIPVYCKNGQKAQKLNGIVRENHFKDLSWAELDEKIQNAQVVSFDFFDTLFMRTVCSPRDIFVLLMEEIKDFWTVEENFQEIRNRAIEKISKNYSYDELYSAIEKETGLQHDAIEKIKIIEIELEKKVLVPRHKVLKTFCKCLADGKEVYLISDMYLPKSFYTDMFKQYNIEFPSDRILLSNELGKSKSEGILWKYYVAKLVKGRRAFHLGDHEEADVEIPRKLGVDSYLVPNPWKMLQNSSIRDVCANITTQYDSVIVGNILKRLFANPYALTDEQGRIKIQNNEEMGYLVFGPVILTFLLWLMKRVKEMSISKLVFLSRDGYFLKEDFEYLCGLQQEKMECCYLTISRQLAMSAAIESEEDLLQYATMPYSGTITELFEDRFGISNVKEIAGKTLEQHVNDNIEQIKEGVSTVKKQYHTYIDSMQLTDECGIVDLGYYGNNQRYLNKLSGLKMPGFYFNANCSVQNPNMKEQKMFACFQNETDITGKKSMVLKKMIYLESFLTAPCGMVKGMKCNGEFIYAQEGNNQKYFKDKIEINRGVKQFIHDYVKMTGDIKLQPDTEFIDQYYGLGFDKTLEFSESVKQSFWNDNAMMNRIESGLFG